MNRYKNIRSFFVEWSPTLNEPFKIDHDKSTIYLQGYENYVPGIFFKRLNSTAIVLDEFTTCRYIVHTNLSSVWNLNLLMVKLGIDDESSSIKNRFRNIPSDTELYDEKNSNNFFKSHLILNPNIITEPYPSGCGFILSRVTAQRIVGAAKTLYSNAQHISQCEFMCFDDDIIFGKLLQHLGFDHSTNDGTYLHYQYSTNEEKENITSFYHIRCRIDGLSQAERCAQEIPLMNKLIDTIYEA